MLKPDLRYSEFAESLKRPVEGDPTFDPDMYYRIGHFCYQAFVREDPRLNTGGVEHGFHVAARLVHFAAKLYPLHAQEQGIEATPEDLQAILLNSAQTPMRFANMPSTLNSIVESYFGLKSYALPRNLTELYTFEPGTARGTLFIADDEQFFRASAEGESEMSTREYRQNGKCPMRHVTEQVVWPATVNLAAEAPEAFARDLAAH